MELDQQVVAGGRVQHLLPPICIMHGENHGVTREALLQKRQQAAGERRLLGYFEAFQKPLSLSGHMHSPPDMQKRIWDS